MAQDYNFVLIQQNTSLALSGLRLTLGGWCGYRAHSAGAQGPSAPRGWAVCGDVPWGHIRHQNATKDSLEVSCIQRRCTARTSVCMLFSCAAFAKSTRMPCGYWLCVVSFWCWMTQIRFRTAAPRVHCHFSCCSSQAFGCEARRRRGGEPVLDGPGRMHPASACSGGVCPRCLEVSMLSAVCRRLLYAIMVDMLLWWV